MHITFANGKFYTYTKSLAIENDYFKGIKRKSIEIHMPINVISYIELDEILSDTSNLSSFLLTGNSPVDMDGNIVGDAPQNLYEGYDIRGKVVVDDEEISVKLFKKSDEEIENEILKAENAQAVALIDELLIALEV